MQETNICSWNRFNLPWWDILWQDCCWYQVEEPTRASQFLMRKTSQEVYQECLVHLKQRILMLIMFNVQFEVLLESVGLFQIISEMCCQNFLSSLKWSLNTNTKMQIYEILNSSSIDCDHVHTYIYVKHQLKRKDHWRGITIVIIDNSWENSRKLDNMFFGTWVVLSEFLDFT